MKKHRFDVPVTGIDTVLAIWDNASKEDALNGARWYREAREFCEALASASGHTLDTVCAVVSAFSINDGWKNNKLKAARFLSGTKKGTKTQLKIAASAIEDGPHVAMYKTNKSGRKIREFYENLRGNPQGFCVDRWMYRVCGGSWVSKVTVTPKRYRDSAAVLEAAYQVISPNCTRAEFQATLWVTIRRMAGLPGYYG